MQPRARAATERGKSTQSSLQAALQERNKRVCNQKRGSYSSNVKSVAPVSTRSATRHAKRSENHPLQNTMRTMSHYMLYAAGNCTTAALSKLIFPGEVLVLSLLMR